VFQDLIVPEVVQLKKLNEAFKILAAAEGSEAVWKVAKESLDNTLTRRMFVVPSFEIYNGVAGLFDFGPPGTAFKDNLLSFWKRHFVYEEGMLQLECTTLTPQPVLKTSGHVDRFADLMVKDTTNGECFRADKLLEDHIEVSYIAPPPPHAPTLEDEMVRLLTGSDDSRQSA
jgi:glycyl-tRNA synthetase